MIGYVLGLVAVAWMPSLQWTYLLSILPVLVMAALVKSWRLDLIGWSLALILGFVWASVQLGHRLPASVGKVDVRVTGLISTVVNHHLDNRQRFELKLQSSDARYSTLRNIRLTHYANEPRFSQGDWVDLKLRIQMPFAYLNNASPDAIRKALQQRIDATGYVREVHQHQSMPGLRQQLYDALSERFSLQQLGFLSALLMGETGDLNQQHWDLLKQTGTVHLAIVSGLHLGVLTLAGLWFGRVIVIILQAFAPITIGLSVRLPILVALLLASLYLWFGGAGLALQRAWVLAAVLLLARLGSRSVNVHARLKIALILVTLIDPLSVLDLGFWLSFGLVWVLLQLSRFRLVEPSLLFAVRVQLWLSLVMLPILLVATGQLNLLSFATNLIAIPWVSLGVMLAPIVIPFALYTDPLAFVVAGWVDLYWEILTLFASVGLSPVWIRPKGYFLIPALIGVALLILPLRLSVVGLVLLISILTYRPDPIKKGFRVHILDVGQGQSAIIDTPMGRWVYDTGPVFRSGFSAADQTLIPVLMRDPHIALQGLIISHSDLDHAGGVERLLAVKPAAIILAGQPSSVEQQKCRDGFTQESQGVSMWVSSIDQPKDDNDSSCVLMISYEACRLLIAGDLSNLAERRLIKQLNQSELTEYKHISWLHLSHHGSRTSSSDAWLNFWQPKEVIISRGRNNPFGHPHPDVMSRLALRNIPVLDTAVDGEIVLTADAKGCTSQSFAHAHRRYWH